MEDDFSPNGPLAVPKIIYSLMLHTRADIQKCSFLISRVCCKEASPQEVTQMIKFPLSEY